MKTTRGIAAVVLALSLGLAGCSAADQKATNQKDASSGEVTVLVHDSFNLPKELIAEFEKESGYKLRTDSAGDAGVVNQLVLQKDTPKYDAAYGIDGYSAYTALDADVFAEYSPAGLPQEVLGHSLEGKLTAVDMGDVCINTDHAYFQQNNIPEPTSIADLAKPEYSKLLVVQNPATSATGFAFLVATVKDQGDKYLDFWKQLLAGGAKVAAGWSDSYYTDFSASEGKGAYPLVVSYSASPAETKGATGIVESTCTRQYEYAGVLKGAANSKGGQAFVDFMMSKKVQDALPENMYMYPTLPSAQLPEDWAKYAKLVSSPLQMPLKDVATQREAWVKAWTGVFEGTAK